MSGKDLSIITVTFNAEKFILPTIESVINQTYRDFEYLVIDGKSSDDTTAIIQKHKDHIDHFISESDQGVYDAMNKGLKLAKGKYVLFLNAGDEFSTPTVLENIFNQQPNADLYYGETQIINQDRKILGTRSELTSRKLPDQLKKESFLQGQVVSHQSFIAKKSLCLLYNLKYKCSADIDWMLQIVSKSTEIKNVNQPISKYLQGGISDRQLGRCWSERLMILLKYFNPIQVLKAHIQFLVRFLYWGRYRSNKT